MKKCKKYSLLIYKEIDGIISDKEQKELENHITLCESCNEEYKLIKALKKELSEDSNVPLPDNFKTALHRKLVDHNISKSAPVPFFKRLPVNLAATLCLALGITIFAVNSSITDIKDITSGGSEASVSTNQHEITNEPEKINMRMRTADTAAYDSANDSSEAMKNSISSQVADDDNRTIEFKSVKPAKVEAVQDTLAYSEDSKADATENSESMMITDATLMSENVTNNAIASSGGSGGSSAALRESESTKEYITLNIPDEINISGIIPFAEKNENGTFFVPMDKLDEVKELLKDYNITIENENDETLKKDKFIIK